MVHKYTILRHFRYTSPIMADMRHNGSDTVTAALNLCSPAFYLDLSDILNVYLGASTRDVFVSDGAGRINVVAEPCVAALYEYSRKLSPAPGCMTLEPPTRMYLLTSTLKDNIPRELERKEPRRKLNRRQKGASRVARQRVLC